MADIKLTALPEATSLALTDILLVTKSPGGAAASNKVTVSTLLNTTGWTSYGATSTIVGWSSFINKTIYYKKVGTLVFVTFWIDGTSNATTTSFTLPIAEFGSWATSIIQIQNNSVYGTGQIVLPATSTVICYPNTSGGAWTASGAKGVYGQFFYESA